MNSYDPLASPHFDEMETNDGATSPNIFRETPGRDTPAFDNDILDAATDPTYKDPINSQKSTTKSVPMDISLLGKTLAGSQRSEAAKQTSEAEGRNSRQMLSPLRGSPAKSPLRPAQPTQPTTAAVVSQLNGSFKGVLPKDNGDASLMRNSPRNQKASMDAALNSSVRHVHAGELSRVPAHLLSNNQVYLMVTPLVFNSGDNSWTCQDGIMVPPNTATEYCGFSIRHTGTNDNVTLVDPSTLTSARKPRSTSTLRASTARKDSRSSSTRAPRQASSIKGSTSATKGTGRKMEVSPVPFGDDEMDNDDEKAFTMDLNQPEEKAATDEEDPDYAERPGNKRGRNSSGMKTADEKKSSGKKSSDVKFKTPARTSSVKASGRQHKTSGFTSPTVDYSLPPASGVNSTKKTPEAAYEFLEDDPPGPKKATQYKRTPQLKRTQKTPTSTSSANDKAKGSTGVTKKSVVKEEEKDTDKSDTEEMDGPLDAKKASEKDDKQKNSRLEKGGQVTSSGSKNRKVRTLDESDDEEAPEKDEEKSGSKPLSNLPEKYFKSPLGDIKKKINDKYEPEEKKYQKDEEEEEEEEETVEKLKRPSKVASKPALAKKKSVVEDMDEDEEPKVDAKLQASKSRRRMAPSDALRQKEEEEEAEKKKGEKAPVKSRKRSKPDEGDAASERATVDSDGPSSSKGLKKTRGSTAANIQSDSATGSRESSQVGRKKDKEGTKDEAKKGRKKSGSIGVKKSESEFVVAMSKSLTGEVRTRFDQVAQKLGWDVRTDLEDDVTHLAVSLEDEKQRLTKRTVSFLKAVLKGVWIVDPQWLVTCATRGEKAGEEKFEVPGAINQGKKNGPKRARESIGNHDDPKLFFGCNFFFKNVTKLAEDFKLMIEMGGGKVMQQEPHKRNRPPKERLFHAAKDARVGNCHYFILDDDVKEGVLNADLPACAVVPGSWLSDSIECYQLKEVADCAESESNEM